MVVPEWKSYYDADEGTPRTDRRRITSSYLGREAIGVSRMEISSRIDIREHRHCAVWDSPYQIDGQALV